MNAAGKGKIITWISIATSLVFVWAVVSLVRGINDVKKQNMRLELLLMSEWQDYTRSFVIFQRLKNLPERAGSDEPPGDERILLEARYESVILNSDYTVFPDVRRGKNFAESLIRIVDRRINPGLYEKIDERSIGSEKFMELGFFMEINKNYSDAVRHYTVFLELNKNSRHNYHHIAMLHLSFCYLMSGYPDNAESLARSVLAAGRVPAITESARYILEHIRAMGYDPRSPEWMKHQEQTLERGLRYYSLLNYNRAIAVFGNYLSSAGPGRGGERGDLVKALYYLARSYEETGRFGRAVDIYRKLLDLREGNPYREKGMKRLLLLRYIYRIAGDDMEKAIADNLPETDRRLLGDLKELFVIGRDLPEKRKRVLLLAPSLENETEHISAGEKPAPGTVLHSFMKFHDDLRDWPGRDETVLSGIMRAEHIIKMGDRGTVAEIRKQGKIKIYLKDGSMLLGDLEAQGKNSMTIRVFGSRVDVKNEDIMKWENVK